MHFSSQNPSDYDPCKHCPDHPPVSSTTSFLLLPTKYLIARATILPTQFTNSSANTQHIGPITKILRKCSNDYRGTPKFCLQSKGHTTLWRSRKLICLALTEESSKFIHCMNDNFRIILYIFLIAKSGCVKVQPHQSL